VESDLRERMRLGMTGAVRRLGGARRVTGTSLVALLCASALAPVVAAGVVVGPILLAGVGVVGAVGAGALTDVVMGVVDRLRGNGKEISQASVENELALRLEEALASQENSASALREAVAALLRGVDAVAAVREATEARDEGLVLLVAEGFAGLDERFSEFTPVIEDIRRALWDLQESAQQQQAVMRVEQERARQDSLTLLQVREVLQDWGASASEPADMGVKDPLWSGCPYLGLVPFEERDARVFYGRNELVRQLVQRLLERLDGGGILLVVGASGAGKSSLLRAGLMHSLAAGALGPGSEKWPRRVIRPTDSPMRELARHLADMADLEPVGVYESLSKAPDETPLLVDRAVRVATGLGPDAGTDATDNGMAMVPPRLVLVVDQFEELFHSGDESDAFRTQREAFVKALRAAAAVPAGPPRVPGALVVVAVRGDFLDQTIAYAPLAAAVQASPFAVGPMSEAELRQAITGPAAEAGLDVKPDLVDTVISELRERANGGLGSGALPLMSQAMAATWKLREGNELTLRAYRRAGGIADAVNRSAQDAYDSLTSSQQDAARVVFTRLTAITQDGQLARRQCSRVELYSSEEGIKGDIDAVIGIFSAQRLLVLGEDSIEISHDVLLNAWTKLSEWISEDRKRLIARDEVRDVANRWVSKERDASWLLRGRALLEAQDWSNDPLSASDPLVTEFVAKSLAAEIASEVKSRETFPTRQPNDAKITRDLGNSVHFSRKTNDFNLQVDCLADAVKFHLKAFEPFRAFVYWQQLGQLGAAAPDIMTAATRRRWDRAVNSIWLIVGESLPVPILWLFSWFTVAALLGTSVNYHQYSRIIGMLSVAFVFSLAFWFVRHGFRHRILTFPVLLLLAELLAVLSFERNLAAFPYVKGWWWAAVAAAGFLILLKSMRRRYFSSRIREDI
jgi:Novel STAND NTPase 1